jgi:hypothetical protein
VAGGTVAEEEEEDDDEEVVVAAGNTGGGNGGAADDAATAAAGETCIEEGNAGVTGAFGSGLVCPLLAALPLATLPDERMVAVCRCVGAEGRRSMA